MYEAVFKAIDDVLRKDAGCSSEMDYIEQTSWVLFLKYLDDYENTQEHKAQLDGTSYRRILDTKYRWSTWAVPKVNGNINHKARHTGDDLTAFVNDALFPYLAAFKNNTEDSGSVRYKVGEIFGEIKNKLQSGYILSEVIEKVDELHFLHDKDVHELSNLYEDKIKNMGNAGRNGGEYYTPRPLIQAIVQVINPIIGETVYDGAAGSAGFLCEAYTHMRNSKKIISAQEYKQLRERTFYGKEKKSLAYVIGIMNMLLHGIESPNITHTNTLVQNIADIQPSDQMDIVLANPPFGGQERREIQQNFSIPTGETAYLFLQHFIKILKDGGRGGVVIKNTVLSNADSAVINLRRKLLQECALFAVLALPSGTFLGTGVSTVVLFFQKGTATENIWYYQLDPGRNLGITNPLNQQDMADFVAHATSRPTTEHSWLVNIADINQETWDLSVRNPNRTEEIDSRTSTEIMTEITQLDTHADDALQKIQELL